MTQRGRKSGDSRLTLVTFVPPPIEPPPELSESEAKIFRMTVASMPAGWFNVASHAMLIEYCRAVDACDHLAAMRNTPDMTMRDLTSLLSAHEKQARLVASLATKMRLTHQARVHPEKAGTAVANKPTQHPPWMSPRRSKPKGEPA